MTKEEGIGVYYRPQNREKSIETENCMQNHQIDNFLHPSYQNSDKWSIQRFDGYSRLVEVHNCRSDQREIGTQIGKVENQIQRPIRVF